MLSPVAALNIQSLSSRRPHQFAFPSGNQSTNNPGESPASRSHKRIVLVEEIYTDFIEPEFDDNDEEEESSQKASPTMEDLEEG
jgi:hypothetical protein